MKHLCLFGIAALFLGLLGCGRPDPRPMLPAGAGLAVLANPSAALWAQLSLADVFSDRFWQSLAAGREAQRVLPAGQILAFTLPRYPGSWFFVYPRPASGEGLAGRLKLLVGSRGIPMRFYRRPALQDVRLEVALMDLTLQKPGGLSPARACLDSVAQAQLLPDVESAAWHRALKSQAHMVLRIQSPAQDSSMLAGETVAHVYLGRGQARATIGFWPAEKSPLHGRPLLARGLPLAPGQASGLSGNWASWSLDTATALPLLRRQQTFKSMAALAAWVKIPLAELASQCLTTGFVWAPASSAAASGLAIMQAPDARRLRNALGRMLSGGALTGSAPPYKVLGRDDLTLQTQGPLLTLRHKQAPSAPALLYRNGTSALAQLDSTGIRGLAGLLGLGRHPLARPMLGYTRSARLEVQALDDGSYRCQARAGHRFNVLTWAAQGM